MLDGLALDDGPDKEEEAIAEPAVEMEYYAEGEKASKEGINYFSREEARTIRDKDKAKAVTGGLSKEFEGF